MKLLLYLPIICYSLISCSDNGKDCIEKLKANCTCSFNYDPVCGCNGTTYPNACAAECASITEYEPGECLIWWGYIRSKKTSELLILRISLFKVKGWFTIPSVLPPTDPSLHPSLLLLFLFRCSLAAFVEFLFFRWWSVLLHLEI